MHLARTLALVVLLAIAPIASAHPWDAINAIVDDVEDCAEDQDCSFVRTSECLEEAIICMTTAVYTPCPDVNENAIPGDPTNAVHVNLHCEAHEVLP